MQSLLCVFAELLDYTVKFSDDFAPFSFDIFRGHGGQVIEEGV